MGLTPPNLLLVAALFVGIFALALPFVWTGYPPVRRPGRKVGAGSGGPWSDFVRVFSNRHIRLIAGLVLVTVVVKQVVDYEFNEAVAAFAGDDRDAITSFQGYVFGAKDALPLLVLLPLGPLLKRWGVGLAVLMLPVAMLGFTAVLAAAFSIWTATLAKAGDSMFRYSAERTAREVLYVPVPTELKLKAKAYIDVAVEKGFGKALTGLLIFALLGFGDYRRITWMAVGLSIVWCIMAVAAKRQYVTALAESIRGRFANLEGGLATLTERSTLAMVEDALRGDPVDVSFGLDLVEQAGHVDAKHLADEMELLLDHPEPQVRIRVLRLLKRFPNLVSAGHLRGCLTDTSPQVREEAVGALAAERPNDADAERVFEELLSAPEDGVRVAALSWLVSDASSDPLSRRIGSQHVGHLLAGGEHGRPSDAALETMAAPIRCELALTAGLLEPGPLPDGILGRLLEDDDPRVVEAAVRSAGLIGSSNIQSTLISKLADPSHREAVREALAAIGVDVIDLCAARLHDPGERPEVSRNIPPVLARIRHPRAVTVLLATVADRRADRETRFQAVKALNKLRAGNGRPLDFDAEIVLSATAAEVEEAVRYADFSTSLDRAGIPTPGIELLKAAIEESWEDRREVVFRLLGLVYPRAEVYRSHSTLTRTDERAQANALEWMERTLGHGLFQSVLPVLVRETESGSAPDPVDLKAILEELCEDSEAWVSSVAASSRAAGLADSEPGAKDHMDLIEKTFLLQKVDLLEGARSSHLGLLASIADELEVESDEVLLHQGEPNDSLYVIARGAVELSGVADQTLVAGENTPFGTWSLIDSDPSVVGARRAPGAREPRDHDLHARCPIRVRQGAADCPPARRFLSGDVRHSSIRVGPLDGKPARSDEGR